MVNKAFVPVLVAGVRVTGDGSRSYKLDDPTEQPQQSFRAARLVGDSTRFLFATFPKNWDGTDRKAAESLLEEWQEYGVDVHGTRYAWLGYSDSHVKGGKVVLFHEDEEWTSSGLLDAFSDVYEVFQKNGYGKYAARFGLSFSSTVDSQDVSDDRTVLMEDLRAPDGSLHTDGCGMIRDTFAREICAMLNLPLDTSVFQIRRGGFKGLLIRYPDEDFEFLCNDQNKLLDKRSVGSNIVLAFRESMLKYEGGPTMLEVNDHSSRPSHARLNETFILLLLTNGLSLEGFRRLLLDQLALIGAIANDRDKALKAVSGELDASSTAFHQDLYTMLLANHDLAEPYVASKLRQFQQSQYKTLYDKLNIPVDSSAYLFGVVDEYGVLESNEVFVNIPGWTGVLTRPKVVVGRNPSYSPGDLRIFKAVYREKLTHLNNCIVFSRKAPHSIPDTMASGDLDGDTYLVIWDPEMVPPKVPPYEQRISLSSAAPSGSRQRRRRTEEDFKRAAVDTFLDHRFNVLLRSIAVEWKRRATSSPQLANDSVARRLQPLVESALDAMKSGADIHDLRRRFQVIKKIDMRSCASFKNPLDSLRGLIPLGDGPDSKIREFVCDERLIIREQDPDLWEQCMSEAPAALAEFNKALSGAISLDKQWEIRYGDEEKGCRKNKAPRHAELVTEKYRAQWFGGGTFAKMYLQRVRASAWYYYGYSMRKQAFAWLGMKYLNEIRAGVIIVLCLCVVYSPSRSVDKRR
ncbi:RdRP-domain-containing protein [Fomitopsis betulina]|nr:RdRP-domain-containing protein [Fomitopsis betulina]